MKTEAHNILVVGPSWVGDMVMAQSLFKLLKIQDPTVHIDVLAPAWSFCLLERMPEVRRALLSPLKHKELKLRAHYRLARQLRSSAYSQVIVLRNSFKSALIPFWSHIPKRTGWYGEWPRFLLLNDARHLKGEEFPLMVERFAKLALPKDAELPKQLPWPSLEVSPENVQKALNKFGLTVTQRPILALGPGAEFGPSKRWPAQYYAEVANAKLQQGWDVWILGSKNDQSVANEIMDQVKAPIVNLSGKTDLAEVIDLLSSVTAVIGNDSGMAHIAAALRKPLIAIYGSTTPGFTPPLSHQAIVLSLNLPCSPCYKRVCPLGHWRCMLDLSPQVILNSLDELMAKDNSHVH